MARSYPPINALIRGLELLSHISAAGSATIRDLHARTGISKPTIVRNLETLEYAGYVSKNSETGTYSLTARVLNLSSGYQHHHRIMDLATPVLDEFRQTMPWPSDLAVFDGEAMVIVETNRSPGTLALNRSTGTRLSVTDSALGRAYLAFSDAQTCAGILDRVLDGEKDNARTQIERQLKKYREQGFSENDQSLSKHTRGIGVPILNGTRVEACINTIVLSEALSMDEVINRCVPPLQEAASNISRLLQTDSGASDP